MSCASWNMPPANPAKVGKHIDASTPLRFMSRTRSWMSYAPGRISANPTGSKPHSSLGHVTTAFRPIDPTVWPSNNHFSVPSSLISTCGTPVAVLGRRVALEHVGRFDDVVVDADEDQVVELHGASRECGVTSRYPGATADPSPSPTVPSLDSISRLR